MVDAGILSLIIMLKLKCGRILFQKRNQFGSHPETVLLIEGNVMVITTIGG
jgi:hypothetical protein